MEQQRRRSDWGQPIPQGPPRSARRWALALAVLVLTVSSLPAQEAVWHTVTGLSPPPADALSAPASALLPSGASEASEPGVSLGRPVQLGAPIPPADAPEPSAAPAPSVLPIGYETPPPVPDPLAPLKYVARGEPPDTVPPPVGGAPPLPPVGDGVSVGVATDQPLQKGFWEKCREWFHFEGDKCSASGRCCFQSDHCFDYFASPVSNPFLFEDPRSLTEVRPIFIYQSTPHISLPGGGYSGFFGTQARVALTDRWSVVMNELGLVYFHRSTPSYSHTGFAQMSVGPKWTFYRNPDTSTVAAAGVNFQIPTGSGKDFQNTGTLSIAPYLSAAQAFRLPAGYGAVNLMGTTGYSLSVDNQRSEYYYLSGHVDYNVANLNKIYPFMEVNWFHYTQAGTGPALGFEGTDLFNFGSSSLGRRDFISLAFGARYKFCEPIQTGLAIEFPVTSQKDMTSWRITWDIIFRF